MTEFPPLDPAVLDELRTHVGAAVVARVIEQFSLDVAQRLAKMPTLAPAQMSREAHGLKGSALEVGATALSKAAHRLEREAVAMSADARKDAIDELGRLAQAALDALAAGPSKTA